MHGWGSVHAGGVTNGGQAWRIKAWSRLAQLDGRGCGRLNAFAHSGASLSRQP
jgi:hypothetical protein